MKNKYFQPLYFDKDSIEFASEIFAKDTSRLSDNRLLKYIGRLQDCQEELVAEEMSRGSTPEGHTSMRVLDVVLKRAYDEYEGRSAA
ncbi:hypothetical protein KW787_03685 [Candidatus Pacearchaeota archaeon]|nr:hypothetical protein [Candidatus Pacearchaeota archaeon]